MDQHRTLRRFDLTRSGLVAAAATVALGMVVGAASAQDFPSETIEMASHAAPGGGTDITARLVLEGAKPVLGVDMVLVYKEGGVARAMDDSSVIVVGADSEIEDYEGLIEASKQEPLAWGVAQVGGTEHIGLARWADAAGIEYRVVPFGSGGEMLTALRSGAVAA